MELLLKYSKKNTMAIAFFLLLLNQVFCNMAFVLSESTRRSS